MGRDHNESMFTAQFLSAALAASTPDTPDIYRAPPDFGATLDRTEFSGIDTEVQLVAFDAEGEVIGMIALWVEPDGRIILTSDYADGYAETVMVDGRARTEATLPPEVITTRAAAMLGALDLDYAGRGLHDGLLSCSRRWVHRAQLPFGAGLRRV